MMSTLKGTNLLSMALLPLGAAWRFPFIEDPFQKVIGIQKSNSQKFSPLYKMEEYPAA